MKKFQLVRDVTTDECPWLDRDFLVGEVVYPYHGNTYGCITFNGVAVTEVPDKTPFLEIPEDALELVF